ncbi:DMT family transporter [Shewanella salipaludis]|uniref:DMT family transporter n=1 Tax=Shewanella salipaludis TaxID=2723052 RepID=A0A972JK79_9GAMM|nr:DMT family transporter [Shewanella salipaludis]NMH64824.1 DMT family transporter [Shewanella salipaludis]
MTALMYGLMIGVWGFSWIAIKWQQGEVSTEVSILYRFAIAAMLMFIIGKLFNKLQKTTLQQQAFFALQGLCLFCCNFLAFYNATHYIASGLTAVVMASAPIFNAVHGKLFYRIDVSANFWPGMFIGLAGIGLLFGADLAITHWSSQVLLGLGFSLAGTWFFSMGNMISMRNSRNSIQPFTATSYAMAYGCLALLLIIAAKGLSLELDWQPQYVASLLYLAIPASVIGFTVYLMLVDRMGANNAAYLLLITPVIALLVSSLFEGYRWTWYSSLGLMLVLTGNLLTQRKQALFRRGQSAMLEG